VSFIDPISGNLRHSLINVNSEGHFTFSYNNKRYLDLEEFANDISELLKVGKTQAQMCVPSLEAPLSSKYFEEATSEIYYHLSGKEKLALGWADPECLKTFTWNKKSDVWSWGVLMWELFSFGSKPPHYKNLQKQFLALKAGTRLKQPNTCSDVVWKVILKCWEFDENKRPDFVEIKKELKTLLNTKDARSAKGSLVSDDITENNGWVWDEEMCSTWSLIAAYELIDSETKTSSTERIKKKTKN